MGRQKILIIDDEPSLLGLLAAYLGEHYDVLSANSGEEGCSLFDSNHVSLVLMDLKMKGIGGIEALRRIRGKSASVPVIVMTGYSTHDGAIRCADLGVQGYLLKPPRLDELKRRIDHALGMEQSGLLGDIEEKLSEEKMKSAGTIVKSALKVIHDRFRDPSLSRNLIAEAVGISDDYLSKQFHKDCGVSIPEYINRMRMAEAGRLLAATNTKISEIAVSQGFSSISYFSSMFKKHFEMTPEQYRREKRIEESVSR